MATPGAKASIHENRRRKMYNDYQRKLLGSRVGILPFMNKEVEVFNLNQHAQKKLFDIIYEIGKANGFTDYATGVIVRSKSGMPVSNFKWAKRGSIGWKLWELENICNVMGIKFEFKMPKYMGDDRYEVTTEGVNGELLILSSKDFPKFHITFNKNNLYDFHVDFSDEKHIKLLDSSRKQWRDYFKHVKHICEWYFVRRAKKKKLPFEMEKFKSLFILKFKANETMHRNISAQEKPSTWHDEDNTTPV